MPAPDPLRFTNAVASVQADPEGYAVMRWRPGPRQLADYQEAMNVLLRVIRALGTGKALVDHLHITAFSEEERHWIATHWLPRAVVQGNYRYAALLAQPHTVTWLVLQGQQLLAWPEAPTVQLFTEEAEAREWLRQQIVVESRL
jgi:hypothetical protein